MIRFSIENLASFWEEAEVLFPLHWREVAVDQEQIKPDMDLGRYRAMEQAGTLLILTARSNDRLVGYILSFVLPHFHYTNAGLMALTDMYFLLPEFRTGNGARMFMAWECELRKRGVVRAHTSCKVHQDHEPMLRALGWRFTDKTFGKLLKG